MLTLCISIYILLPKLKGYYKGKNLNLSRKVFPLILIVLGLYSIFIKDNFSSYSSLIINVGLSMLSAALIAWNTKLSINEGTLQQEGGLAITVLVITLLCGKRLLLSALGIDSFANATSIYIYMISFGIFLIVKKEILIKKYNRNFKHLEI